MPSDRAGSTHQTNVFRLVFFSFQAAHRDLTSLSKLFCRRKARDLCLFLRFVRDALVPRRDMRQRGRGLDEDAVTSLCRVCAYKAESEREMSRDEKDKGLTTTRRRSYLSILEGQAAT